MKKPYESIEMEIIAFEVEDVIVTSGDPGEGGSEGEEGGIWT